MSDEQKQDFHHHVVNAIMNEEKSKVHKSNNENYALSFSGTALDSSTEKDAAEILRGDDSQVSNLSDRDPFLVPPLIQTEVQHQMLRKHGKWCRFLGSAGCYMYIHVLTKEVVSICPEEFVDDKVVEEGSDIKTHPGDDSKANGLPIVPLSDLPMEVDRIVKVLGKTPLIIDGTAEGAVRTYFAYKALLEDVSTLVVPYAKSGVKRSDVMERCRVGLVAAMKTGATFALYLGGTTIEHADWKKKLCKKDTFPLEAFVNAGARLLQPEGQPRYRALFREPDLDGGLATVRDGFRVIVISTLEPKNYIALLEDSIPLGYMHAIYVV